MITCAKYICFLYWFIKCKCQKISIIVVNIRWHHQAQYRARAVKGCPYWNAKDIKENWRKNFLVGPQFRQKDWFFILSNIPLFRLFTFCVHTKIIQNSIPWLVFLRRSFFLRHQNAPRLHKTKKNLLASLRKWINFIKQNSRRRAHSFYLLVVLSEREFRENTG